MIKEYHKEVKLLLEIFDRIDKVTKNSGKVNLTNEFKNDFLMQLEEEINSFRYNNENNIINYVKKFGELRHQLKLVELR